MGIRNRAIIESKAIIIIKVTIITKAIVKKIPTFFNKRNAKARVRNVVQNRSKYRFERINSRNAVFIMNEFRNRDVTQTVLEPKRHCFKNGISRRGSKRYQYLCFKCFDYYSDSVSFGVKELKPKGKTTDGLAGVGDIIAPFMLSFVASIWLVLVTVLISVNKST